MDLKKILNAIFWVILAILLTSGVVGFVWMLSDTENYEEECAKEYGGSLVKGYCTYVENGTSKSFNIWTESPVTIGEKE